MTNKYNRPKQSTCRLLSAARHLMKQWGKQIELHHVKGHQDSKSFGPYNRDATLNIKADKLAKEKLATYRTGPVIFHIPGSQGVCYAGKHRIEKDLANTIRNHMNGQKTIAYWLKRRELTQGIWNTIDWESIGRAMKELLINRRRWVAKYVSGHFATGKNMQQWKFRSTAECPRCHDPREDKQHLLSCPDTAARERWEKAMKELESWLRDENTERQLRNQLMAYLRNRNSPNETATTPGTPMHAQDAIGKNTSGMDG